MKENEIQIGDWVRYRYNDRNGHETVLDFRVDQLIRRSNLEMCVYSDTGDKGYASQIEPIPLTAEILEKNGWNKCGEDEDGSTQYECDYGDLTVTWWTPTKDCPGLFGCWKNGFALMDELPINYIHELQHALRLCKIEKEITL